MVRDCKVRRDGGDGESGGKKSEAGEHHGGRLAGCDVDDVDEGEGDGEEVGKDNT